MSSSLNMPDSDALSFAQELIHAADKEVFEKQKVIEHRQDWAARLYAAARLMPEAVWIREHARRIETGEGDMKNSELDAVSLGLRTEVKKLDPDGDFTEPTKA